MKISELRKMTKKDILDYLQYIAENYEVWLEAEE